MNDSCKKQSGKYLDDICVIRILLIILLIVYHACCPFVVPENWPNLQQVDVAAYVVAGRYAYSAMLECFVFISGLLLGYQVIVKGEQKLSLRSIVPSKLKRLMLPSVLFSLVYYFLFLDFEGFSLRTLHDILFAGVGHMWFLPVLFYCFLIIALMTLLRLNRMWMLPVLFMVAAISSLQYFKLGYLTQSTLYFLFFFFAGYCVGVGRINLKRHATPGKIAMVAVIYLLVVESNYIHPLPCMDIYSTAGPLMNSAPEPWNHIIYLLCGCFDPVMHLLYSSLGVLLIYLVVNCLIDKNIIRVSQRAWRLSGYCFGVYIFQEFILRIFYYNCGAALILSPKVFPLLGFLIALPVSLLLTHLSLKTRIGRFLLG